MGQDVKELRDQGVSNSDHILLDTALRRNWEVEEKSYSFWIAPTL